MRNIPFNIPPATGREPEYLAKAIANHKLCGDGPFTKQCHQWLEERTGAPKALLTTSGTSALEMAALLCNVQPGDEVILPSFTFVSTADAFVQRGAKVVYVDIRPDTMNIDETKIEAAITDKTTCICVVHYAGVACEMDTIMDIARRHHLKVVEDAAQGVMSSYKGRALGTIGDVAATASTRPKTIPWVKAARYWSTTRRTSNGRRSFARRAPTGASSCGGRSTSTLGWTTAPAICPAT